MQPDTLILVLVGALVLRILYKRLRKSVGRQRFGRARVTFRIVFWSLFAGLLGLILFATDSVYMTTGAAGIALAQLGLRLTAHEHEEEHSYYTPNPFIGFAVFSLFAVRLGYRIASVAALVRAEDVDWRAYANRKALDDGPPITLAILFFIACFYACYYIGILVSRRRVPAVAP